MQEVEQETRTSGILHYEGELPENARVQITEAAEVRKIQIVTWKGETQSGKPVELQMEFHGSPRDPLRFSFKEGTMRDKEGTAVYAYSNVKLNPFNRRLHFDFGARDIADIFIIAQKALLDDVGSIYCIAAFEEIFGTVLKESTYQRKVRLSRELAARKYLP